MRDSDKSMEKFFKVAEIIEKLRKAACMNILTSGIKISYSRPFLSTEREIKGLDASGQLSTDLRLGISSLLGNGEETEKLIRFYSMQIWVEPYRVAFLREFQGEKWRKEQCPFCGGQPGLSRIKSDGKRMLICHFCWTEWDFARVSCAFCNNDAGEYAIFELDNIGARLDFCVKCNQYLKTFICEEELKSPAAWDLKSLFMDDWANKQGFVKPEPSLIGIDFLN